MTNISNMFAGSRALKPARTIAVAAFAFLALNACKSKNEAGDPSPSNVGQEVELTEEQKAYVESQARKVLEYVNGSNLRFAKPDAPKKADNKGQNFAESSTNTKSEVSTSEFAKPVDRYSYADPEAFFNSTGGGALQIGSSSVNISLAFCASEDIFGFSPDVDGGDKVSFLFGIGGDNINLSGIESGKAKIKAIMMALVFTDKPNGTFKAFDLSAYEGEENPNFRGKGLVVVIDASKAKGFSLSDDEEEGDVGEIKAYLSYKGSMSISGNSLSLNGLDMVEFDFADDVDIENPRIVKAQGAVECTETPDGLVEENSSARGGFTFVRK